jgi:hypothetical protein
MRLLAAAALAFSACSPATDQAPLPESGRFASGYFGCTSKDRLSEFVRAAGVDNQVQLQALVSNGDCFPLDGLEYSVVSRELGTTEVRVTPAGGPDRILFTIAEAVR